MSIEKVKVLYIGGVGRSGSTLIDLIVGQADGFFSVGELRYVWQRNFQENQLCASGEPFRDSPFWQEVVQEAFGGFDQIDAVYVESLREKVERLRHQPRIWLEEKGIKNLSDDYKATLKEYQGYMAKLYRAIQKVSKCEYILDSSKNAPHAYVLKTMDEIDLHVLHLVRDSRAFAYSWQRKKLRPEIHWKTEYMEQFPVSLSIRRWNIENTLVAMLQSLETPYRRLRYEDFAKDPEVGLKSVWSLMNIPEYDIQTLIDRYQQDDKPSYSVSGNPIRFGEKREIKIRLDREWQEKMPFRQKAFMTLGTLPLLLWYRYLP
jgi:hypothetical protein